jgi:paraquat-inducible protein B
MSETASQHAPARARTRRSRRVPVIWVIPLLAIAIGVWLAWDTLSREGPTIKVTFDSAEGLQAGQSQLKYRDIVLGTVKSLDLTPDHSHVVATIATTRQAEPLLTSQTVFWVVKPRLFAGNISGLDTLLSGSYVGMLPESGHGTAQRTFIGREDPPIIAATEQGHTFQLKANRLGSISLGSPVFFRDLTVGQVLGWDIGEMARSVTLRVFVRAPYDRYVTDETRFWNASGVSVKLGATGVEVQLESLRALLLGGVAFSTPDDKAEAAMTTQDHVFPLFADQQSADAASYSRKIRAVSYFPGSVRGLAAGSDVTMHGLVVGHVTSVRIMYDAARDAIVAPVEYQVEPERIVGVGKQVFATMREAVEAVLNRGLRAHLETASLITGQQMIALDFEHNAAPAPLTMDGEDFVVPTTEGGGFTGLQASATALLDKVNDIPFKAIGDNLNGILHAGNTMANGQQMQQALTDLSATLVSVKGLMTQLDSDAGPALKQLPQIAASLEKTLATVNKLALSINSGYGGDTQFNRDLERLLIQTNDAVRSFRALADLLARHPEALVKGRPSGGVE